MAQSGYTPIQLYYSTTNTNVPVAGNLLPGELGFNIHSSDFSLYAENSAGTVTRLMNNPAGLKYPTADGTSGQAITTNASGVLSFSSVLTSPFTANVSGGDFQLSRAMLIDCGNTSVAKGNSGTSTQTYDYTAGSVQTSTATGNHTLATSNWPPTGNLGVILILLTNGETGDLCVLHKCDNKIKCHRSRTVAIQQREEILSRRSEWNWRTTERSRWIR